MFLNFQLNNVEVNSRLVCGSVYEKLASKERPWKLVGLNNSFELSRVNIVMLHPSI